MSDFRTKFLGLTVLGMAMAAVSYGQVITCPANSATTLPSGFGINLPTNPSLRVESETELVSDVGEPTGSNCTSTIQTTGQVLATLSAPVTSKAIPAAATFTPAFANSEAILVITDTSGGANGGTYSGFANGTTVTFSGVVFPTSFTFHVYNIRVNAAASSSATVTESLLIQYTVGLSTSNYTVQTVNGANYINVGSIQTTLVANTILTPAGNVSPPASFTALAYQACAGNPIAHPSTVGSLANNLSFTVALKELVGGAFKTQLQEEGSWVNGSGIGASTSSTEINVALTGIPTSATVYVPVQVVGTNGTTLQLVGSVTGLTTPAAVTSVAGVNASGVYSFTATSNTVNIVYSVTAEGAGAGTFRNPCLYGLRPQFRRRTERNNCPRFLRSGCGAHDPANSNSDLCPHDHLAYPRGGN